MSNLQYLESAKKEFEYYKQLGEKTFAQLTDEQLFNQINSGTNSIATIVKHLWGNMLSRWTDFLTTDGEKEWRKRDEEFENDISTRQELLEKWEEGWSCLFNALNSISDDDLSRIIYIRNQGHTILEAINRQLSHYPHHIGQIVFIGKMLSDKNWNSLSIPKGGSKEYNQDKFSKPISIVKNTFYFWFIYFVILCPINTSAQIIQSYDVVIYGGTSAGVSAAIQSSRMGKKVILIEPTHRMGGLTTGGLGKTDIGNKQAIGGLAREFYQNIKRYYLKPENWIWEKREDYTGVGYNTFDEDAMWAFEPSVALKVFHEMVKNESNIHIVYNQRLNRETGVKKEKQVIKSIQMESGQIYQGKMFMDCTYEGDLMAASGVSYTVGRESNSQYGESLNGVQANNVSLTLHNKISRNAIHHNFIEGVSPYLVIGNPKSGLLPFVRAEKPGIDGQADHKIQAYCYRMTLTNLPENRIPFKKPVGYKELDYELLFRNYEAAKGDIRNMYNYGDPLVPWINSAMPNRKTDTNNQKGFSTDFIGQNYRYPEASYDERLIIAALHKKYQQGLMWTLSYHPRIPKQVRDVVSQWGTCKDEFVTDGGWTDQLYIREARRMVSDYVMTQRNCEAMDIAQDVIGLGAYQMDSHPIQRYVDVNGFVKNEGNVEAHVDAPFPISYKSIIPKKSEITNLFIPVCLSSSHIAYGSIRMEPVFMVLGQSAAIAASIAIDKNVQIQEVFYLELRAALIKNNQILK